MTDLEKMLIKLEQDIKFVMGEIDYVKGQIDEVLEKLANLSSETPSYSVED